MNTTSTSKRGRPNAAASSSKAGRGGRTSAAASGSRKKAIQEEEDDVPDLEMTHADSIEKYEDVRDWEELVVSVETIERGKGNELLVYLTM